MGFVDGLQDLDDLVEAALEFYGEKKLLDSRPLIPSLEKDKDSRLIASPLKFPGKITTDLVNGRLFISDSNHHRIVWQPIAPSSFTELFMCKSSDILFLTLHS